MVGLLASLVAGCVPIPVSTIARAPRFTQEQVDAIGREPQSRESLEAGLGFPDLRRDGDRIWIYTWTEDYGAWELVPIKGQWSDNRAGPVESHRFLWVFEFDSDGGLRSQEFVRDAKEVSPKKYCTMRGVCLHHTLTVDDVEFGFKYVFDNERSAVTVAGEARERIAQPEPRSDECVLVVWPDREWDSYDKGDGLLAWEWEGGLALTIDNTPPWSTWRRLPAGAFARLALPAGVHAIAVRGSRSPEEQETRKSTRRFECAAGEQVYLAIGSLKTSGTRLPIELRPVEPTAARALIADMAQLLPPD